MYSHSGSSAGAIDSTTAAKILDLDFDVKFNMPQRVKGKMRSSFSLGGSGVNTCTAYVILKVRKYDGTTETDIANSQSETVKVVDASTTKYVTLNVEVDITSAQHFKRDEILRITVEVWAARTVAGSHSVSFYHDPKDRGAGDGSTAPYTAMFENHIPFKLVNV